VRNRPWDFVLARVEWRGLLIRMLGGSIHLNWRVVLGWLRCTFLIVMILSVEVMRDGFQVEMH
jgi:hypothetical protein